MLYKIKDGVDCFELNPELLAVPEFAKLTERQFRVVALVADRRSPLRTLPDKARREKACLIAGYGMEGARPDKNARTIIAAGVPSIETAIATYKSYQFDENQETLDTINAQIHEIKEYLKSDKSEAKDFGKALEQAAKLGERLPGLVEAKQKLEALLQISTEQKPEIMTGTSADVPDEYFQEGSAELPAIEVYMQARQKLTNE
jgi:hypothetical protein